MGRTKDFWFSVS